MKNYLIFFLFLLVTLTEVSKAQTPLLWTFTGSISDYGHVLRFTPGGAETRLYEFNGSPDGMGPQTGFIKASNGLLYGMTIKGGIYSNGGTLFSYNVSTNVETVLHSFGNGTDGITPNQNSLIQAKNGLLYGMTSMGGANDSGTIFSYDIASGTETVLHSFTRVNDGVFPRGALVQAGDGLLYGATIQGGTKNFGILFSFNIATGVETVLHNFTGNPDGQWPNGSLIQAKDSLLYGMASNGGQDGFGMLFSYNITTHTLTDIHDFNSIIFDGKTPGGSVVQAGNGLLYGVTGGGGTNSDGVIFSYNISTTTYKKLYDFGTTNDGTVPQATLIQASDSLLYGTTNRGGTSNDGTVFSFNISTGKEKVINSFTGVFTDGTFPTTNLLEYDTSTFHVSPLTPVICSGRSVNITAGGATTYTWAPLTGLSTTTGATVSANPTVTTTYTVKGISGGTTDSAIVVITVNATPVITVNSPSPICNGNNTLLTAGGGTTYQWAPSSGLNFTTGANVVAGPTITTTYSVTGISIGGCSGSNTLTLTVNSKPTVTASPSPAAYCAGGNSTLTAIGANTYSWLPTTNLSAATGTSITASPTITTTYTVTGTGLNGCSATKTVAVRVNANPTITATPTPAFYCVGGNSILTASGATTYNWLPATNLSATTGTSITANPTITTTYTVTAGNDSGCITTKTVTVTVNAKPTITATPNPTSYCVGGSSTLSASGAITYTWLPATNLNATTGATITASPTITTTYFVTGSNANGCTATKTLTVTVNANPTITATPNPAAYCAGGNSTLSASGATTYSWLPATNLSATTGAGITASPAITATYTVTGTNANGCTATKTLTVTVNANPVITATPNPASYCVGGNSTLSASGATTYSWLPATNLSATTGAGIMASPTATTTYTVTGANANGCTAAKPVTITVNTKPDLTSSANPPSYCPGGNSILTASGAATYSWLPDANLSATTGASITANPTATTTYTVTGTNTFGCSATKTSVVVVSSNLIISASSLPASYCPGGNSMLTASGATTYTWLPDANLSATTGASITATPTITTTYTVTGSNSGGCSGANTATITVNSTPAIVLSANPSTFCAGANSILIASGAATYSWDPSSTLSATTGDTVTATPADTTTYIVTGTDINGCSASGTVKLSVNPNPILTLTAAPGIICSGELSILTASGGDTYTWSPSASLSAVTGTSVNASPTDSTTYYVIGTDANGCSSADSVLLSVQICTSIEQTSSGENGLSLYPNPASSTLNISVSGLPGNYLLKIYNLLGQQVKNQALTLSSTGISTVDLNDFAPGAYELILTNDKEYYSKRFVHFK